MYVDCIVAPYEADAQLAFLYKSGLVDLIISEDSDLTLFGADRILFKLDSNGNGTVVEMSKLNECLGNHANNFTIEKFRYMCIMSGCDYLASLHGIGLGKSCKFWSKVTNLDLRQVLPKIPAYLNMHQITVTPEYIDGFIQADQTFLYQLVYDPKLRTLRPLNSYKDGLNAQDLPFCGQMVEPDLAFGLALGNVDLHSLGKVNDFNPHRPVVVEKPRYGRRSAFPSIWQDCFSLDQIVIEKTKEDLQKEKEKAETQIIQQCFSSRPKNHDSITSPLKIVSSSLKRKRDVSPALVCTPDDVNKILEEDNSAEKDIIDAYR